MSVPIHIAIIMDGNRRWAKNQGLAASAGHKAGVQALEKTVKAAATAKVKYMTVYALSTENLKNRNKLEIGALFSLLQTGFVEKLPMLKKEGVRVAFLGETEKLPAAVKKVLAKAEQELSGGQRLQLNIAINYGSRAEIVNTVKQASEVHSLTEANFGEFLNTAGIPDPELLIRTGGEKRLSNFLLWQIAYTELYFTDTLWPDFDENELKKALEDYSARKRNFGS